MKYTRIIYTMDSKDRHNFRKRLVSYAMKHWIKPAAREYRCSPNTVRLWIRRYQKEGYSGLVDRSRAPHHCPHKKKHVISCGNGKNGSP